MRMASNIMVSFEISHALDVVCTATIDISLLYILCSVPYLDGRTWVNIYW